jgi:hypothetical protein
MTRRWVNRRVETFSFLDADTVRRRMSVDLTVPRMGFLLAGATVFVPLMMREKRDLRHLDVRGPDDRPLSVLNTEQGAAVAVAGIKGHLETILPGSPLDVDDEALARIVAKRGSEPLAEEYLARGSKMDGLLAQVSGLGASFQVVAEEIRRLIEELASSFMLLVPLEYRRGRRLVCKVSYDTALRRATDDAASRQAPRTFCAEGAKLDRGYARGFAGLATLGLVGRPEVLACTGFDACESYHAEVVPPKDAYVVRSWLTVFGSPGSTRLAGYMASEDQHMSRSHLRARPSARDETATVTVVLHAHRQELLLPLAFSAALISVVLGLLPGHVYELDGQTLAALLLVPFALSAYYIRSQDNSYVMRMLAGARLLAFVPLAAALCLLMLVAVGLIPPTKGTTISPADVTVMRATFLASAYAAVPLLGAVAAPWLGRRVGALSAWAKRAGRSRQVVWRWGSRLAVLMAAVAIVVACIALPALPAATPSRPMANISCHDPSQRLASHLDAPGHGRGLWRYTKAGEAGGWGGRGHEARTAPAPCARNRRRHQRTSRHRPTRLGSRFCLARRDARRPLNRELAPRSARPPGHPPSPPGRWRRWSPRPRRAR